MERRTEAAPHIPHGHPRLPRPLPRVPARRRRPASRRGPCLLDFRLAADALLLARACGLRIGELLDSSSTASRDPGNRRGSRRHWKTRHRADGAPDDETVTLIDRICATRLKGRPLPYLGQDDPSISFFSPTMGEGGPAGSAPRTRSGRRGGGIGRVKPHQLRHNFATAMVNAGVSLQASWPSSVTSWRR